MSGACNADIAVDADGPEGAVLTVCGRAVEIPVAGSALPGGHSPLAGFFRCAQLPESTAVGVPLVCCATGAVMVAVDVEELFELVEAIDDDEFCRWTVLRGAGANILLTSSELIAKPLLLELHPIRELG